MKLLAATLLIIIMAELVWPSPTHTSVTVPATMTPTPVGTATRKPGIGEAVTWEPNVYLPMVRK